MAFFEIVRRKDSKSLYMTYPDPATGSRRYKSLAKLGIKTEKEAKSYAAKELLDYEQRLRGGVPEVLLIDALERWYNEYRPTLSQANDYNTHYYRVLKYVRPDDLLSDIIAVSRRISKGELERGMAGSTINSRLSILKTTATLAYKVWDPQWLSAPETSRIVLHKTKKRSTVLSEEETLLLIQTCRKVSLELADYVQFIAYTGIRRAELRRVKPEDMTATISGQQLYIWGKGYKNRTIPLYPDQIDYIQRYAPLIRGKQYYYKPFKEACARLGWLTFDKNGKDVWQGKFAKEGLVPHDLRHTYGVWLFNCGKDQTYVMKMMGHRDATMCMLYLNLTSEHLRKQMPPRLIDSPPEPSSPEPIKRPPFLRMIK